MPKNVLPTLLLAALAAAATVSCTRRTPAGETAAPSLVLMTYGYAPASAFGPQGEAPTMTPVFDGLPAKGGGVRITVPQAADDPVAAARHLALGGGETLPQALRKRGYRTAAFVADPAMAELVEAFGEGAAPDAEQVASNRQARAWVRLVPGAFEEPPFERFDRGEVAVGKALDWLSREAGIAAPSTREKGAKRKREAAAGAGKARLAAPVFLWVHLADPVFQDSPEHVRVSGPHASRLAAEAAYMDLQLGRMVEFLSRNGLSGKVKLAVVGLHGEPQSAEDVFNDAPDAAWRQMAAVVPSAAHDCAAPSAGDVCAWLGLERDAVPPAEGKAEETVSEEDRKRRALEFRLRRPQAGDEALEADCRAWAEAHPDSADAWCWLGVAQLRAKKPAEALESHRRAFELEKGSAFRMSNLGLAHLETGEVAQAVDQLENAYLADPSNGLYKANLAAVLLRVGMAFTSQGMYPDASACLSRVVLLQPRNPFGHVALGQLQQKLGRKELAEASYRKALEVNPKFAPAQKALRSLSEEAQEKP